jgi:hypothetical protein
MPADLDGIVVLYESRLKFPHTSEVASTLRDVRHHVATVLGLDRAEPAHIILKLTRGSISVRNKERYRRQLGPLGERTLPRDAAPIAFDFDRKVFDYNAAEVRQHLDSTTEGHSRRLRNDMKWVGEKGRMFAAVLADIEERLEPSGIPRGYRAIACLDPQRQLLFPGDLPRISHDAIEREQLESRKGKNATEAPRKP